MRLNELSPAEGSKPLRKRVGRGTSSGIGKTCGRGHKGQKSRSGGYSKVGFEGGQMPLQRRVPKMGFRSRGARYVAEIRLSELNKMDAETIDLAALRAAGLIQTHIKRAKVFASGELTKAVKISGLGATKGARAAIEAAGGSIEEA